ncbi:RNA polymerase sigma factor [soil metagenome]
MTAAHERALIRRTLEGDRAAAEELIRAHQPSLCAYLLRLTQRPDRAEDVAQEAFFRALTHLARYDPRFRFSTWLFTIAKRLYVNQAQRLTPSFDTDVVSAVGGDWFGGTGGGAARAGEDEAGSDAREALKIAMESLSADQRDVVVLFYQLQWSVEQISEYLDCAAGTIKSHLHRARQRMREALERNPRVGRRFVEALAS